MTERESSLTRETSETRVSVHLNVDGTGRYEIDTGNGMLDHLLAQLSRHGLIDVEIAAKGDVHLGWHHLVEDVGILLGRALKEAVGEARGIFRMGHAFAPLDETLALVVVDFGGRGYAVIEGEIGDSDLGGLPGDTVRHFLESMAREGSFNLHVRVLCGVNNHHIAEAVFKALARAVRAALTPDSRRGGDIPSTKGTIG